MPHSQEIRNRAVDAYLGGAGSYEYVADLFQIGSASLKRWVCRKRETGDIATQYCGGVAHLIDARGLALLNRWLNNKNDLTLRELRDAYNRRKKHPVSVSTIGRAVRNRLRLPRKKRRTGRRSATGPKTNF